MQQTSYGIKTDTHAIRAHRHAASIKRWLSPADPSTNVNHARKSRHTGTGIWFLDSDSFTEWKLGLRKHLWLYGMPGCGKTVLSATILDHIEQMKDSVTLTFFFDFTDIRKQKLDDMLRSLVFQLYSSQPGSQKDLDSLFTSYNNGQRQPDTDILSICLKSMMRACKKLFIVLDALDECSERSLLLAWMGEFIPALSHIQIIATGRPEEEIERNFHEWVGEGACLLLNKKCVDADIRSYIRAQLDQGGRFKRWAASPDILRQIKDAIESKADGILEGCLDLKEIEATLHSLPEDLNATYARILEKIPVGRKKKAIRLLQFLVYSKRPLTLGEAIDVVAIRPDDGLFEARYRLRHQRDIVSYCPGLVSLVQASEHSGAMEVQLAHFTVKEYLMGYDGADFTKPDPKATITLTCLSYLGSLQADKIPIMKIPAIRTRFPLARYAAETWMEYAKGAESSRFVVQAATAFLRDEFKFSLWARLFNPEEPWDDDPGEPKALPLYFACLQGLKVTAENLVSSGADINAKGGKCGTALQAASGEGYQEVIKLLLSKGAKVNAQGGEYGTALQAASYGGHREIIKLLLSEEAEINVEGGKYGTALQAACHGGHLPVVELLLANGAHVNAEGGWYGSTLQAASHGGHLPIVELLLANGAHVNAEGGCYGTAIYAASHEGHLDTVELLLARGG
ncbi:hypothetical protein N7533_011020 [Penicillium manginii]|uniref:uncharacterized protein n=1 Tax=Penicillium manginii TaxID=203109 RepID=UPI002549A1F5|nr:uncharacterized protein N7533_011020 [Penicillium manginii]KAJ5741611.1 hypothetical protein N7533_011020 [Penicillium manginii]